MGVGAGIVIITSEGIRLEHSFRLGFRASNNEVEYETLLAGLRVILDMGAWEVEIYSDSQLVVSQVQGSFKARDSRMKEYLRVVRQVGRGAAQRFVGISDNPRRFMGETPFSLTYGAEAIIPAKINLCSARVAKFAPTQNDGLMVEHLDLLEEYQEMTTIRLAEYQQKLARHYNRDVKTKEFGAGNLVLRKVMGNMQDTNAGKLALTWEGPYKVTAIAGAEAYYLEDLDEKPVPWPWNIHNLKKFYQ
ncbi:uncharacterized protein LOC115966483 [Quercus lobata]|uniref:uncharacterized protein LOC115966483 n=1 Tax=Quercus lobata TaxID=97700 RepID=UPI0012461623|nr:uncharacterized protein LOC115966483 [Quercus lobata]